MSKFNQALIAGASSIALFAGALTLITPAANANTSCSTYGNTTYCNGSGGSSSFSTYGNSTYYNGSYNGQSYGGSLSHPRDQTKPTIGELIMPMSKDPQSGNWSSPTKTLVALGLVLAPVTGGGSLVYAGAHIGCAAAADALTGNKDKDKADEA